MTYETTNPHYFVFMHLCLDELSTFLHEDLNKSNEALAGLYFNCAATKVTIQQKYKCHHEFHQHFLKIITPDFPEGGVKFIIALDSEKEDGLAHKQALKNISSNFIVEPMAGETFNKGRLIMHPFYGEDITDVMKNKFSSLTTH